MPLHMARETRTRAEQAEWIARNTVPRSAPATPTRTPVRVVFGKNFREPSPTPSSAASPVREINRM